MSAYLCKCYAPCGLTDSEQRSTLLQMLWTFGRFGYQDETLMDMMHDIAVKLQANCNSKSLAEVVYAMAQMGWADVRLHNLVADYAMDNIQVQITVTCHMIAI